MFASPAEEWKALTARYRSMCDEELAELAEAYGDLTPTAQQVLRDELKLRRMDDPGAPGWKPGAAARHGAAQPHDQAQPSGVEYTWKTPLCRCSNPQEAWQISEALKRAGIENWVERPSSYTVHAESEETPSRVLVPADQIEEARAVLEQPIPADIVEESHLGVPEYEVPVCPRCGAADPLLEDVDPVNTWRCEACGAEWEDAEGPEGAEEDDLDL